MNYIQDSSAETAAQHAIFERGRRNSVVIPHDDRAPYVLIDGVIHAAFGKVGSRVSAREYGRERTEVEHSVIRKFVRLQIAEYSDPAGAGVTGRFSTSYPASSAEEAA